MTKLNIFHPVGCFQSFHLFYLCLSADGSMGQETSELLHNHWFLLSSLTFCKSCYIKAWQCVST